MNGWRWSRHAFLLVCTALGAVGCPAALDDNFSAVPNDSSMGANSVGGSGAGLPGAGATVGVGAVAGESSLGGSSGSGQGGDAPVAGGGADSGEGGSGGAAAPCSSCLPSETCCADECVDLRFDSKNCRLCGLGCPGTTCDNSSCTNTCAQGFIDCNHNVVDGCEVDPAKDPGNCGNCGVICGFQLECAAGNCVCPAGTADCDGVKENGCEKDTSSDAANCGGCGQACGAHQGCVTGACECEAGFDDCNQLADDGCEAPLTADATCGSCSLDCGLHGSCVGPGQCGCAVGYLECDAAVAGCETATTDPTHCGACTTLCQVPTPACDGVACITGCGALTTCGASCVDTQTDLENCGGCDKPVGVNQTCVAGKPVCVAGYGNCDADPTDCEVNTQIDVDHCGSCPNVCKDGALCDGGTCQCAPNTPNDCGTSCEQCCNSGQCSDGDSCTADICDAGVCSAGAACAGGGSCCAGTGCFACCGDSDCLGGKVCSGNQCVNLVCTAPQVACNQKCINPVTDAANCGSCGNYCGVGRTCAASACTPKWVPTGDPLGGFVAREKSAYAAMGSKVFIWGGSNAAGTDLADGAVYDPVLDTWAAVPLNGAPPSARVLATAVWTGSVVVVWGGGNAAGSADYANGGRYDPVSGTWQTMSTAGAPFGRRGVYGFWTGSRVLFYGGADRFGTPSSTTRLYDPVNDVWSSTNTNNLPSGFNHPTVGWTGNLLLVYGGQPGGTGKSKEVHRFDLAANSWARRSDGPSDRYGAFGTWDGSFLVGWSGAEPNLKNDGGIFDPVGNQWDTITTSGQPTSRGAAHRQTGWSARTKPGVTRMWGGMGSNSTTFFTTGGLYNSATDAWTLVSAWPSGASHLWGVGVWTGTEFVVWGGRTATGSTLTAAGERYRP